MRRLTAILLLSLLAACAKPPATIDSIDIRLSGKRGVFITLNREQGGQIALDASAENSAPSRFALPPERFDAIAAQLEPFRQQATPSTDESMAALIDKGNCPAFAPYVTDQGAIWIRWHGPNVSEHCLAELGCDPDRNRARNTQLQAIIGQLPVPPE